MKGTLHKTVQALIAAACVMVIALGAIWLIDRQRQSEAMAADKARVEATITTLRRQDDAREKAEIESRRTDLVA